MPSAGKIVTKLGVKLSQFWGKLDISPTDFRTNL